jgi:hypothetical protein
MFCAACLKSSEETEMLGRALPFLAVSLLCVAASRAHTIGIFMDTAAATCTAQVGDEAWVELHVIALLQGDIQQMTGAQFRITGVPAGWTSENALWVPEPSSAISLGHPLFPTSVHPAVAGVNVAFRWCQFGPRVLLGRIVLLGAPTPGEVRLRVEGFELAPQDPGCPLIVDCQVVYALQCVLGGEIVLNGPARGACQPTGIQASTWAGVKSLYRDAAR